jgi:hypothetical protein
MNAAQSKFGVVQIGILVLALATALIHIYLAIPETLIMFYLNGAGYLALTAAFFLPQFQQYRRMVRWALIGFAAVTVIGWAAIGERNTIAYIDKLIELALIALLWIDSRSSSSSGRLKGTAE